MRAMSNIEIRAVRGCSCWACKRPCFLYECLPERHKPHLHTASLRVAGCTPKF